MSGDRPVEGAGTEVEVDADTGASSHEAALVAQLSRQSASPSVLSPDLGNPSGMHPGVVAVCVHEFGVWPDLGHRPLVHDNH